ncbi:hypothetical protein C8F04DRAFT_1261511 [Mycena alexandri]|uniref:Uncharacterized protein n=1 Tax=Mycena alexandri TaxID=1745969 RepID=A0AAD6STS0_9AGAR|nr:hypothetical protein C8F04DRAFT_1261511 [Mycena alexandri]
MVERARVHAGWDIVVRVAAGATLLSCCPPSSMTWAWLFLARRRTSFYSHLVASANSLTIYLPSLSCSGSNNPFIKTLFSVHAITTQVQPHNEDTVVNVEQPVKHMRAPSMCRKGIIRWRGASPRRGRRHPPG